MTAAIDNMNRLSVRINGKIIKCLVDTGAAVTVLSQKLFEEMKDQISSCQKSINQAVTADGSILTVSDCGEFDLKIGNCSLKCKAHVMPQVPHQLILGMDFFKRHQVVIDFQNDKIIFKTPQRVKNDKRVDIPAHSEIFLLAKVNDHIENTEGELLADSALSDLGLVVAHCVGTVQNCSHSRTEPQ